MRRFRTFDGSAALRRITGGLAAMAVAATVIGGTPMAAETPAATDAGGSGETLTGSYLAAHHAEFLGDSAAAAEYLGRVLEADADNPDLRRRVFVHLVSSGRIEDALEVAEGIEGSGQTAALATITRAVSEALAGEYGEAERLLDSPMAGSFGQVIAPMLQAWVKQGAGDSEAAIGVLEELQKDEGFKLYGSFHAALVHDVAGNAEKAESSFAASMVEGETPSLRLIEAYVSFLARAGRIDDAEAILDQVAAENREAMPVAAARENLARGQRARPFVGSATDGLAEALFEVAAELRRENAPNVGLILARLAVYLRPDFDFGHVLIAEILDDQGRVESAIESYDRVHETSQLGWQVRVRRAELLSEIGRTDEAIAILESMAAERGDRPEPLMRMGHIMRGEERFDDAVIAYDRAAGRIATLEPHHWSLLYARGIALERSKDWVRAEEDFLRALEFNPDQPYVLNYLGYSWIDQGVNLERAREMIERAVELRPRDGYIVDSLGWALYRMDDFAAAVDQLEKAAELRPEDPVINDHLGDAYWQVGRHREARFQWTRALSLNPEEDQVEVIRDKIENGLAAETDAEQDS
ncbi:MAG: tetratricopeptide repeat protein [Alphaproteobacteria bacterium]|nr:tetratricopeptide repeat protein [Alphaproteobacteria bacterium]